MPGSFSMLSWSLKRGCRPAASKKGEGAALKRYIFGGVLTAIGVMGFLQASGQYNFGLSVWPVILALAGGLLVSRSLQKGWRPSWIVLGLGLWVGCIGLFTILFDAGVTTVTGATVVKVGWPLLISGIGIAIIAGRCRCSISGLRRGVRGCAIGDRHHGRDRWVLDGDLDLGHGIGDFVIDLTTAEITKGAHRIKAEGTIGDMVIRVPDGVSVTVDAAVGVGRIEILGEERSGFGGVALRRSVQVPEAEAELAITARLRIGDLSVVRLAGGPVIDA